MTNDYRWLTNLSQSFLENDYLVEGQTVDQRVDEICNAAEKILNKPGFAARFKENFKKGWYSFSTPIWTNFGNDRGLPISCFGSYISDTTESIANTHAEVMMMTKHGGGTSAYFGNLRPRGSEIKNNGHSDGAVHFMRMFESLINVISQGKTRRGNFAAYLPIDHNDIMEFLTLRTEGSPIQDLSFGVTVPDYWMKEMIAGDKDKRKIWARVLECRANSGYPYIVFIDNANNNTVDVYKEKGMKIHNSNLCVTGDQRVVSDRGLKTAKQLFEEGGNLRLFDNDKIVNSSPMKLIEKNAKVYRINLSNGMSHTVTAYHKVKVKVQSKTDRYTTEDIACGDLKIGDKIAIQTSKGLFGTKDCKDEAFLLGLYQGDGTQTKKDRMIDIWENDFDLTDEIEQAYERVCLNHNTQIGNNRTYNVPKFYDCMVCTGTVKKKRLSGRALAKLGFEKGFVPDWIFEANEESQWAYIKGLFYTDGTVHVSESQGQPIQLSLASIDEKFLKQIQLILANLGMQTSIRLLRKEDSTILPDGKGSKKLYNTKTCYRLIIGNKNDALIFNKNTGFLDRKKVYLEDRLYRDNTKKFYSVTSVEYIGEEDVYCCTVDSDNHHWICNGVVTHNCTEIFLATNEDESFVCDLSSMNILYYDEWKDTDAVELLVYLLDAVMSEFIQKASKVKFMERAVRFAKRHRAIGIGWLGWHSYLQSKMIPFESMEAKNLNVKIAKNIKEKSYAASAKLAQEYGEPEVLTGYGRRHATLMAVAPTKSCTTPDTKFKDSNLNNIDYFEFTKRGGLDLNEIMSIEIEFDDGKVVKYRYDEQISVTSMATVKKIKKPEKQWFELNPSVKVFTDDGIKECKRFYFNGFEPVYELTFSDGNKYKFTGNHKLKNSNNEWLQVEEVNDKFISNNNLQLVTKEYIGVFPTMDMEVPDVHYYVLSNGIHSHNSAFVHGQVSEGIEPHRSNYYIKDLAKGKFTIKNSHLEELLESKGENKSEVWDSILRNGGSVQHLSFLTDEEKSVFKTFAEISPRECIIQAAQRQKYIDQGQSLNLMIHPSIPIKDVNALLIEAWELGVKSLYYQISINAAQNFSRQIMSCANCES